VPDHWRSNLANTRFASSCDSQPTFDCITSLHRDRQVRNVRSAESNKTKFGEVAIICPFTAGVCITKGY